MSMPLGHVISHEPQVAFSDVSEILENFEQFVVFLVFVWEAAAHHTGHAQVSSGLIIVAVYSEHFICRVELRFNKRYRICILVRHLFSVLLICIFRVSFSSKRIPEY